MKRKLAGAAITMLVAGLATGCGDDGKGAARTTTTMTHTAVVSPATKNAFIRRADLICVATVNGIRAASAKIRAATEKAGKLPPAREVAKFLTDHSLPAYEGMVAKLRKLPVPQGDERTIDGLIGSLAGAIAAVKADPRKYATERSPDAFGDANARAQKYGLKACGS